MKLMSGSEFSKFVFRIFNRQPISYRIGRTFLGPPPEVEGLDQTKRYERNNLNIIILIGGAVFFIPFLFSYSTIDPVLSIRFLAWTVLTIITILIFFIMVYFRFLKNTSPSFLHMYSKPTMVKLQRNILVLIPA